MVKKRSFGNLCLILKFKVMLIGVSLGETSILPFTILKKRGGSSVQDSLWEIMEDFISSWDLFDIKPVKGMDHQKVKDSPYSISP